MTRCIVKCCGNNIRTARSDAEKIRFFRLPKDNLIREAWLMKIGEVIMPRNVDDARICSVHFTEQSFTVPALGRLKNNERNGRRRRLLHNALPTLHLEPNEERLNDRPSMEFTVVRRTVDIPIPHPKLNRKRKLNSGNEEGVDSEQTLLETSPIGRPNMSLSDNLPNAPELDSEKIASNPWLDAKYRVQYTPPSTLDAITNISDTTFPRRSQRLSKMTLKRRNLFRHIDATKSLTKRVTSKGKKCTKKSQTDDITEYGTEEGSPPWKRTRRFMTENLEDNGNATSHRKDQQDDPYKTIEELKAQLSYHQSLSSFYINSKADDYQQYKVAEAKCAMLGLEIKNKEDEDEKMFVENEELRRLNTELHAKLQATVEENKRSKLEINEMVQSVLRPYFTDGQIRCIIEKRKWVKWSIDDYAAAISLRSVSPKAYRYLRKKLNFPLPSLSSLRRWALHNFDIREGFLADVLAVMREKSKALSSMEKIAVLTFDEMALTPEMCFDARLEKLVGPCCKVQVMMVRGLFANWKQPIYYKFDQPMTKSILDEALVQLHQAGYQVVAVTSDMGNRGVWGELKITTNNHCFPHPSIPDAVVYVFADVPHLLKLLRNWLMDDGFYLHTTKQKFTSEVFQTLVNLSAEGDLRVAHRITQRVLDARNTLRQAVWPAAQIWSHSAGKAIQWAGDRGLLKTMEYAEFADFILTVNSWFDVQNSKNKYGAHPGVNGFGVDLEQQERILLLMTFYMEQMRVGSRKSLMPFQQGIIISNASLRGLYKFLKNRYPDKFEYLITRRLQQDILENFFSYIRAMGAAKDHPSGYEFRYRLRWYVLGKHSQAVFTLNRNTEEDESTVCMSASSSSFTFDSDKQCMRNHSTPRSVVTLHASEELGEQTFRNSYNIGDILMNCETTSLRSGTSANEHNSSVPDYEIEPDPTDKIVLTQELFLNIIDISPSELEEERTALTSRNIDSPVNVARKIGLPSNNSAVDEKYTYRRRNFPRITYQNV